MRTGLAAGLPQVVLPLFADQPDNAARVDELGAGIAPSPEPASDPAWPRPSATCWPMPGRRGVPRRSPPRSARSRRSSSPRPACVTLAQRPAPRCSRPGARVRAVGVINGNPPDHPSIQGRPTSSTSPSPPSPTPRAARSSRGSRRARRRQRAGRAVPGEPARDLAPPEVLERAGLIERGREGRRARAGCARSRSTTPSAGWRSASGPGRAHGTARRTPPTAGDVDHDRPDDAIASDRGPDHAHLRRAARREFAA